MGDALANLNKSEDALSMMDKAASASDDAYTAIISQKSRFLALLLKRMMKLKNISLQSTKNIKITTEELLTLTSKW
jgi:hypothetical protein